MNVFVETNFVIELALEQQEAKSCERLLELASQKRITLQIPAYSLAEPHEVIRRRHIDRESLRSNINKELGQLGRTAPFTERVNASREIVKVLAEASEYEIKRLEDMKQRLATMATVLPLDLGAIAQAQASQGQHDLSPQDALVYASIHRSLQADHAKPSCFISRNPRDFDDPDLRNELASLNCKYFASFATALEYIEHEVAKQSKGG